MPSLDTLLADIRCGIHPRLYWGARHTICVPVVICRGCGISRADDGTRCQNAVCGIYQRVESQISYEKWQNGNGHRDFVEFGDDFKRPGRF